jgi:hypothetical protein
MTLENSMEPPVKERRFCRFCLLKPACSSNIKAFRSLGNSMNLEAAENCASRRKEYCAKLSSLLRGPS